MILWGIAFALGAMARSPVMVALCGAALLHLGFDFLLHNDDGRAHFWPLSNWIFQSPVSYWDPDHYGNIAGAIEVALSLLCCGILWRRFTGLLDARADRHAGCGRVCAFYHLRDDVCRFLK